MGAVPCAETVDALGSPLSTSPGQGSCRNIPCVEIRALKDPEAKLQLSGWLETSGQSLPFLVCEVKADSSSHIGNVLRCSRSSPPLDVLPHWLQILDRVADGMVFGALLPCEECSGQLVFKSDAYYCTGDVTAWTKCMVKTQTPNRKEWVTPKVSGGRGDHGACSERPGIQNWY